MKSFLRDIIIKRVILEPVYGEFKCLNALATVVTVHFVAPWVCDFFFFKISLIHERHTERGAETQAEGEAGSLRGARCGTRSRDPWGLTP